MSWEQGNRWAESVPGLTPCLNFGGRGRAVSRWWALSRQAGLQEPFCTGWGWWLPWRGEAEAVAVTEAVLVVATWRELLSWRLLSDVERDPPLWHCGLHGERRREEACSLGLGVGEGHVSLRCGGPHVEGLWLRCCGQGRAGNGCSGGAHAGRE